MEGVANFKYLGRPLEQMDDDWAVVRQNFKRAQRVWGRLGKIPQREGADYKVAIMFHMNFVQAVLLF